MTRPLRASLLFSVTCLLGACNATDSMHSQGPWGPPGARRNYPNYSRPWGYHPPRPQPGELTQAPGPIEAGASGQRTVVVAERPVIGRDLGLPPDPLPALPVAPPPVPPAPVPQEQPIVSKDAPPPTAPAPVSPTAESPPGVFSAPKRASSYAGTWSGKDAKGASCVIHLSSVSSLDLYKASTSKCGNENLRNVNSWSFAQDRIVLFSRGKEIARLTGTEASLNGTISSSGTLLTMTR